jgi:hypothetical protein
VSVDGHRPYEDDSNDALEREVFGAAAEIGGELLKVVITLCNESFMGRRCIL